MTLCPAPITSYAAPITLYPAPITSFPRRRESPRPAAYDVFMGIHAATTNRTEPILYPR